MDLRPLGNSDLKIAPIVMGANVFGWTIDEEQSFKILDAFLEAGFNAIDTADVYSRWVDGHEGGESEAIIGRWMKSRGVRDDVVLITKVGMDMGQGQIDLTADYIAQAVDKSLTRLQTDRIDLYLSHADDKRTLVAETMDAYDKLVKAGKIRYAGASNFSAERLRASLEASAEHDLTRYQALQPHYNLLIRNQYEGDLSALCTEHNVGVITYFALAKGFLTGKYRSEDDLGKSVRGGGIKDYLDERGMSVLSAMDEVAAKHEVSLAGIALAWQIASPIVTAPIASATKLAHMQAFNEGVSVNLSEEDLAILNSASA